jgi:hydroxylamine reductase
MFCYQCEQRSNPGCTLVGICGKTDETAVFQDLLVHVLKGLSFYAHRLRKYGVIRKDWDLCTLEGLFTTVTNVNFDAENVKSLIKKACSLKEESKAEYIKLEKNENPHLGLNHPANFIYTDSSEELLKFGEIISITNRKAIYGNTLTGLEELVLYGVKGMAAYADHAHILNYNDESVNAFLHEVLDFLIEPKSADQLLGMAMKTGEMNLKVMELLDKANTTTYGNPVPTKVRITPVKGKAILVSGHDLKDLEMLLKQTEGKGINIYTHGEMLPAHGYPELKQYPHLVGNYGGAWQDQWKEFDEFPGAILMTTNCIQKPKESYIDRIFTCGLVQWTDVPHIDDQDFTKVIEAALSAPGFVKDEEEKTILTGFGHNAVLSIADQVVAGVKSGDIKHFYLIGGCDGAKSGRNYYTELAQAVPDDSIILTLACGKFRFNKLEFGDINGIPRLLDIGQCNDAYSAIKIASALADVFKTDVNSLPLSMILSWYEQKAVAILLTLLYLGIQNIRIGPSLPALIEPEVLNILVEKFKLKPITTAKEDLAAIMAN